MTWGFVVPDLAEEHVNQSADAEQKEGGDGPIHRAKVRFLGVMGRNDGGFDVVAVLPVDSKSERVHGNSLSKERASGGVAISRQLPPILARLQRPSGCFFGAES